NLLGLALHSDPRRGPNTSNGAVLDEFCPRRASPCQQGLAAPGDFAAELLRGSHCLAVITAEDCNDGLNADFRHTSPRLSVELQPSRAAAFTRLFFTEICNRAAGTCAALWGSAVHSYHVLNFFDCLSVRLLPRKRRARKPASLVDLLPAHQLPFRVQF